MSIPAHERVLRRTRITEAGCREWTGAVDKGGYGIVRVRVDGKRCVRQAHRLVYQALLGPVADGVDVHHRCLNHRCVLPEHLEAIPHGDHQRQHGSAACRKCGSVDWGGWTSKDGRFHRRCNECNRRNQRRLRALRDDISR